jgi:hypothetical protein
MRKLLVLTLMLAVVGIAGAQELGSRAPAKVPGTTPADVPNPIRQGGDTIATATVITSLPYSDTGTTTGFWNDYSSSCYTDGAPDVVYRLTVPSTWNAMRVSLCGSSYDTGLQILDASLAEIGCNDDYCGLQSELEYVIVSPGQVVYIVVDGFGPASGPYQLEVTWPPIPCFLSCPDAGSPEGEPPLHDQYVDDWNSGCGGQTYPFQHIAGALPGSDLPAGSAAFCGVSGWYLFDGANLRDTDWFTLTRASASVPITITADAEYATYFFELGPLDCNDVDVVQIASAGPCTPTSLSLAGPAGPVWFWVGPTTFYSPDGTVMYDYVVWLSGLDPEVIATEPTTWGGVKALYR